MALVAVLSLVLLLAGWAMPVHAAACPQPHRAADEVASGMHAPAHPEAGCAAGVCVHAHCHVCCAVPVVAEALPVIVTPGPTPPAGGFVRTPAPRPVPRPPAGLLAA
jgi:hypothetical protein